MIWELAPNEALGMKRIFSIIMEWGLDLPTGTIAFWGTLVLRILTVDYTFKWPTLMALVKWSEHAFIMPYETQCP